MGSTYVNHMAKIKPWIITLLISFLSSILVYILINASDLRVFFAFNCFLVIFLLYVIFFGFKLGVKISVSPIISALKTPIYYTIIFVASLIVLLLPSEPTRVDPNSIYITFLLMSPLQFIKLISSYFLLTVIPGYHIVRYFLDDYCLDIFEKIGFTLALSYCVTNLIGVILVRLGFMSPLNYILALWMTIVTIPMLRGCGNIPEKNSGKQEHRSTDLITSALIFLIIIIVACTATYIVISKGPLGGYTRWDVNEWMMIANNFVAKAEITWEPYIAFPLFFYIISRVSDIPMLYAYAGLQYYSILVFLSIYALIKTFFLKNTKVALFGPLILLLGKIGSLYFIFNLAMDDRLREMYFGSANKFNLLSAYMAGGMMFTVFPHLFTFAIGIFAMIFGYLFFTEKAHEKINLLFTILLTGLSIYSHSIPEAASILITLIFFGLLKKDFKKTALLIVLNLLGITLFEPLYKFFLTKAILLRVESLQLQNLQIQNQALIVFIFILTGIFLCSFRKEKICNMLHSHFKYSSFNSKKLLKILPRVLIFVIVITSVFLYLTEHKELGTYRITVDIYYTFPFWYYIFNLTVPLLIISLNSIKLDENSMFVLSWFFTLIALALLGYPFPTIFWRNMWTNRFLCRLDLPLVCLAARGLNNIVCSSNKNSYFINLKMVFLVLILTLSLVSYAHTVEMWIDHPLDTCISTQVAEAINWVNTNLNKNDIILGYYSEEPKWGKWFTLYDYKILCALSLTTTIFYSNASKLEECLNDLFEQLNIKYIFIFSEKNGNNLFNNIKDYAFLSVFENDEIVIYKITRSNW